MYPTSYPDLLPPNATAFEKAMSGPTGRIMDVPVPIRDLWRWDTCPESHLAWLAWAMSVDLWNHNWPVEKKRNMIRESFELHRHKGTLYTIERYLEYVDAPLRRAIVPPDKAFPGRSMTDEERAAWLARFPQIRIYRYRGRGEATFGAFTRGAYKLAKTFLGGPDGQALVFPYQSDAWERYGQRAFLWDKGPHFLATGIETPLRHIARTRQVDDQVVYDSEQILIPGSRIQSLFLGANVRGNHDKKNGRRFLVASTARSRIVTLDVRRNQTTETDVLSRRTTAPPGLVPLHAFPEQVAERGTSKLGQNVFCGIRGGRWLDPETKERKRIKGFVAGYLPETTAPLRLYDRIHLHDPARLPDARPPAIYLGHARLGMPAYHAQLTVEIKGKRSIHQAGRFVCGHLLASSMEPLALARTAVVRGKAKRDRVLLKTAIHRTVRTSDGVRAGSGFRVGGLIAEY